MSFDEPNERHKEFGVKIRADKSIGIHFQFFPSTEALSSFAEALPKLCRNLWRAISVCVTFRLALRMVHALRVVHALHVAHLVRIHTRIRILKVLSLLLKMFLCSNVCSEVSSMRYFLVRLWQLFISSVSPAPIVYSYWRIPSRKILGLRSILSSRAQIGPAKAVNRSVVCVLVWQTYK